MKVDVCFTPNDFVNDGSCRIAVVIDVLRATTCIATAFSNGCRQFFPVETVEEAFALKDKYPEALLAGERKGLLIPGFNLGNSPRDYTPEIVAGRTIIMSTTNGTYALKKASAVHSVYTAAFANAAEIVRVLRAAGEDTVIICAGTERRFSVEDALCAGLIARRLSDKAVLSDTAMAVEAMYNSFSSNLLSQVSASSHARYLASIGYAEDVALCLEHDRLQTAPLFSEGVIRA